MKRLVSIFFLVCFMTGCTMRYTYTPGESGKAPGESMSDVIRYSEPYNAYMVVGRIDTSSFFNVDVQNNFDTAIDCTEFGSYIKKNIYEGLTKANIFKTVSFQTPPKKFPYLMLRSKVKDLTIINKHGAYAEANGTLETDLIIMPQNKAVATFNISKTGICEGGLNFYPALDPLGIHMATSLIEKIATSPEIAGFISDHPDLKLAVKDHKPVRPTKQTTGFNSTAPIKMSSALQKTDFGSFHALVIGVDKYKGLPPLQTAGNDARAVAELLDDSSG